MSSDAELTRRELRAADGASAQICDHGAQVTSWKPAGQAANRLFISQRSEYRSGAAIRGGVPVIFPQFAGLGPLPKHGFARTTTWQFVESSVLAQGRASARFRFVDSAATRQIWPHAFEAGLRVTVGGAVLRLELSVSNRGPASMSFTAALHSYLRVDDVEQLTVQGLRGLQYRDSAAGGAERVEAEPAVRIRGEVDRIYLDAPSEVQVIEPHRTLTVRSEGFPDVVVWNPGAEKGAALTDMEPGGHRHMLCVEAAVIGRPVELASGQQWQGRQELAVDEFE